ncbi:MAG TPA: peptidase M61 [Pricia sp.]|nr:peptidase M61 [Pricia sp.]
MKILKKIVLLAVASVTLYGCGSTRALVTADKATIQTFLDLKNVVDDKVSVTVDPGAFTSDEVTFYIPKTVPGTYSTDNYGQYIEGLKALDYQGNELTVSKADENTWNISDGKKLDKLTYYVNDTYDTEATTENAVFSPAGTNILEDENFMLNLHGFVGYFEDLKEVPYEITISAPENLQPTTTLSMKATSASEKDDANPGDVSKRKDNSGQGGDTSEEADVAKSGGASEHKEAGQRDTDTFFASRYFEVIDNPILYAEPNTESFQLNDIEVTLSVYSPNDVYQASDLKEKMETMMWAQKAFLGDINSTKNYDILLYLSKLDSTDASGFGALEHHTSTVVVLPEAMPKDRLEQAMIDVVSHEFFHTVTPLNVHSKEIQYFDFNDPKMSRHLWMYEGTTEYFANLFQIQQGLIDEKEFYQRMMTKINNAKSYDDSMSFTTLSQNILKAPYEKNYANVYEKGALINMALDIKLRELSDGEKGVLWLMKELSKKYGKDTPFEDDELIDEIVAMTYPEIRTFFDKHVIGDVPIDYEAYLAKVGLKMESGEKATGYFLDGQIPFIDVDPANDNAVFIREGIELNSFLIDLGAEGGDIIKSINDTPITLETMRTIIGQSFGWSPDTEVTMTVQRGDEEITLEGKAGKPVMQVQTIVPVESVSTQESNLRESWLKA